MKENILLPQEVYGGGDEEYEKYNIRHCSILNSYNALKTIDELLNSRGLELVIYDADDFTISIEKLEESK